MPFQSNFERPSTSLNLHLEQIFIYTFAEFDFYALGKESGITTTTERVSNAEGCFAWSFWFGAQPAIILYT